jgi:hypothetical protein
MAAAAIIALGTSLRGFPVSSGNVMYYYLRRNFHGRRRPSYRADRLSPAARPQEPCPLIDHRLPGEHVWMTASQSNVSMMSIEGLCRRRSRSGRRDLSRRCCMAWSRATRDVNRRSDRARRCWRPRDLAAGVSRVADRPRGGAPRELTRAGRRGGGGAKATQCLSWIPTAALSWRMKARTASPLTPSDRGSTIISTGQRSCRSRPQFRPAFPHHVVSRQRDLDTR